jgi:hypothetical protein
MPRDLEGEKRIKDAQKKKQAEAAQQAKEQQRKHAEAISAAKQAQNLKRKADKNKPQVGNPKLDKASADLARETTERGNVTKILTLAELKKKDKGIITSYGRRTSRIPNNSSKRLSKFGKKNSQK